MNAIPPTSRACPRSSPVVPARARQRITGGTGEATTGQDERNVLVLAAAHVAGVTRLHDR